MKDAEALEIKAKLTTKEDLLNVACLRPSESLGLSGQAAALQEVR